MVTIHIPKRRFRGFWSWNPATKYALGRVTWTWKCDRECADANDLEDEIWFLLQDSDLDKLNMTLLNGDLDRRFVRMDYQAAKALVLTHSPRRT